MAITRRSTKWGQSHDVTLWLRYAVAMIGAVCLVGCSNSAPTTQPSTMAERQDQALRDPFSYNPDFTKSDRTVSGQNDPNGLKRDLHDVLNP